MVTVSEYLAGPARIIKAGEIESMQKQPNFIPLLAFFLANVIVNSAKYEVLGGLPITGIVTYLCSLPLKIMIDEKYFEISKYISESDPGELSLSSLISMVDKSYDMAVNVSKFIGWLGLALSVTTVGYMIANSYISSGPSIELPNSESPLHPSIRAKPNHDA